MRLNGRCRQSVSGTIEQNERWQRLQKQAFGRGLYQSTGSGSGFQKAPLSASHSPFPLRPTSLRCFSEALLGTGPRHVIPACHSVCALGSLCVYLLEFLSRCVYLSISSYLCQIRVPGAFSHSNSSLIYLAAELPPLFSCYFT